MLPQVQGVYVTKRKGVYVTTDTVLRCYFKYRAYMLQQVQGICVSTGTGHKIYVTSCTGHVCYHKVQGIDVTSYTEDICYNRYMCYTRYSYIYISTGTGHISYLRYMAYMLHQIQDIYVTSAIDID